MEHDAVLCTPCPPTHYSPVGHGCKECPLNSEPSLDRAYCECLGGHYYDHWTPGLRPDEACKPCVGETVCRTLKVIGS